MRAPALAAACAALLAGCGSDRRGPTPPEEHPPGLWTDTRYGQGAALVTEEERDALAQLGLTGYADAVVAPREVSGVTRWDRERAAPGFNLYCSGHGAEAFLMEMDGRVVHRWAHPYETLPGLRRRAERHQGAWRRVRVLDDGSLLAIHEGLAIVRVDRDSKLVWHRDNRAHHDFDVRDDGHVLVLTQTERSEPRLRAAAPILEDAIEELDAEGALVRRVSLVQALWSSAWSGLLVEAAKSRADVLHANTLELLRESPRVPHSAFQPGCALVAFRELDAIAVVDLEREVVQWLQQGPWRRPHDPRVLDDGRLLVFDNMGNQGYSRVLAWDVPSASIAWQHAGDPPASFFSIFSGAAQRLPNGNTLVTESYAGRAFEVTLGGETVWELVSPHRGGEDDELVAVLFDVERLPPDLPLHWLH